MPNAFIKGMKQSTQVRSVLQMLERQMPEYLQKEFNHQATNLPPRYFRSLDTKGVKADLTLIDKLRSERIIVATTEVGGRVTLRVLMKKDEPRIFLRVVAVLSKNKVGIDKASIFTGSRDGMVLDHFVLQEPLNRRLLDTIIGEIKDALETGQFESPVLTPFDKRGAVITVNNPDDTHTTLSIAAHDQVGFLYRVAQVFSTLELSLTYARIRTHEGQINDTFHLVRKDNTVLSENEHALLVEALEKAFA